MIERRQLRRNTAKLIDLLGVLFPDGELQKYEFEPHGFKQEEIDYYTKRGFLEVSELGEEQDRVVYSISPKGFEWINQSMKYYWRAMDTGARRMFVDKLKHHSLCDRRYTFPVVLGFGTVDCILRRIKDVDGKWKTVKRFMPFDKPGLQKNAKGDYYVQDAVLSFQPEWCVFELRVKDANTLEERTITECGDDGNGDALHGSIKLSNAYLISLTFLSIKPKEDEDGREHRVVVHLDETKRACPLFLDADACKQKPKVSHPIFSAMHFDYKISDGKYQRICMNASGVNFENPGTRMKYEIPLENVLDVTRFITNPMALCDRKDSGNFVNVYTENDKLVIVTCGAKRIRSFNVSWNRVARLLEEKSTEEVAS